MTKIAKGDFAQNRGDSADRLTNLKEHQSNLNSASRKSISTLVLLKSLGHDGIFHSGFTSSCNSFSSCENGTVLPSRTTTLKAKTDLSLHLTPSLSLSLYLSLEVTTRSTPRECNISRTKPISTESRTATVRERNFDSTLWRNHTSRYFSVVSAQPVISIPPTECIELKHWRSKAGSAPKRKCDRRRSKPSTGFDHLQSQNTTCSSRVL